MAKELPSLQWIEELLPKSHLRKSMFGGFAYYCDEKMVLLMFESPGSRSHKGRKFDFELWSGCMFPVDQEHQAAVKAKYTQLVSHPILPKWFYIPLETEDFENKIGELLKEIRRKNPLFGTIPKQKKSKNKKVSNEKIDTRRPRMFSDEPAEDKLKAAKNISDLRNLGPMTEKGFHKAGIKTAAQFIKLGWKKSMVKLVKTNPKALHSLFAYAMIGALKNQNWNRISLEDKEEARDFIKELKLKRTKSQP